jgi:hypothetical protein
MKTKLPLMVFLGLMSAGMVLAATPEKSAPAIEVTFVAADKFTDVKDDHMDSERGREAVLEQIKEHLVTHGARYLAKGQRLQITVTDVDLAGDFEPWRGINFHDIRIVKDIYPPRMDLEFKLVDAEGKVVSEGKRQLRDLGYMLSLAMPNSDPLRYDKEMLNDWLRQEFKRRA